MENDGSDASSHTVKNREDVVAFDQYERYICAEES